MTNSEKKSTFAIGLDIGGSKIAGGVVKFPGGNLITKKIIPTNPERGGQAVLNDTISLAEGLMKTSVEKNLCLEGIGMGVCELVDLEGNIKSSHILSWKELSIQKKISQIAPTILESDVRASALAEAYLGLGKKFNIFVYISVGTGISYCMLQNKIPFSGAKGNAMILASSPFTNTCNQCETVLSPILEEIAAGPPIVNHFNNKIREDSKIQFASCAEEVLLAAENLNSVAVDIVESAGKALGVSVGWLVNVLDPEAVIVGGGLGCAGGLYWDSFLVSTRSHIWPENTKDLPIMQSSLGPDAGLIGAALTVVQKQNNP